MFGPSRLVLASSFVLLGTACHDSGGGEGPGDASGQQAAALRRELALAGVVPLAAPPVVSDELFALGQALFFDKVLSGNEDVACATCHLPQFGTGDGRTLGAGVHGLGLGPNRGGGDMLPRNSPALFHLHQRGELLWDGHVERDDAGLVSVPPAVQLTPAMRRALAPGLEVMGTQAMLPPVSRKEMRGAFGENPLAGIGDGYGSPDGNGDNTEVVWRELNERLLDLPGYVAMLADAYPGVRVEDFNFAHAGNAIAAFEARAFARSDSPFERFVRGDDAALSEAEIEGGLEFFRAGCATCHSGPLLTDEGHHNVGLPQIGPGTVQPSSFALMRGWDLGREHVTGERADRFRFRTPSLRNVELTGPWGHAGQFARLEDFVAHYLDPETSARQYDIQSNVIDPELVTLVTPNTERVLAGVDERVHALQDFDVDAVVAFLRSLTADDARDLSDVVPASVPSGLPIF